MSSKERPSILDDLAGGLVGRFLGVLRACAGVFAVFLVLKFGFEPSVDLVVRTWIPRWEFLWKTTAVILGVLLVFDAIRDGFARPPEKVKGFLGVALAFIEKAGTTIVGLVGGVLAVGAVELLLYAIFLVAGVRWKALHTVGSLKFWVRIAAPTTYFFGALAAARFAQRRLRTID